MKKLLAVTFLVVSCFLAYSQETRVVLGKLTVFEDMPVANVTVTAKKAGTSVSTDPDGTFCLVCNQKDIIKVKSPVFKSASKRINPEVNQVIFDLVFVDSPENRILATGLGYLSPEALAYCLEHLSNSNNDFCNYDDIFSLLHGKFPGVFIKNNPHTGGKGVFIRGQKSITQDTEALYVIDGVANENIAYINPCDISSINILKEGGSSIYGSRGANGVVVIETKNIQ